MQLWHFKTQIRCHKPFPLYRHFAPRIIQGKGNPYSEFQGSTHWFNIHVLSACHVPGTGGKMVRPSACPQGAQSSKNTHTPTNAAEMGKHWGRGNWVYREEEMFDHGQDQWGQGGFLEEVIFEVSPFNAFNRQARIFEVDKVSGAHEGALGTAGHHRWGQGQVDGVGEEARKAHRSQTTKEGLVSLITSKSLFSHLTALYWEAV